MVGCVAGGGFCTCLNWASALVRAFECWAKTASFQGRLLFPARGIGATVAGHSEQARRRTSLPPTRVPRFQKQRVFHLSGRGIDAAAELGSEDHQFSGLMPRRAVLDMLGLLQDKHAHVTERDKPGAILEHNRAGESRRPRQTVFIGGRIRTIASSVMVWSRRIHR